MTDARPIVLDLSEWNGDVDFVKMKSMNVAAVGIRASWLREDTRFKEYWAKAKAVGIPRFAYHYRDWRGPGPAQLALFNGLLANDPGELPPALDLEMDPTPFTYSLTPEGGLIDLMPETRKFIGASVMPAKYEARTDGDEKLSLSPNQVQGLVWDFLMGMQTAAKRSPMLYTGYFYFLQWMTPNAAWKQFPLWEAWYAQESSVKVPPPWTSWTFWQFTGNGNGPSFGASGKSMDESLYNGTLAQLQAFAGGVPIPPVSPPAPIPAPIPIQPGTYTVIKVSWVFQTPNDGAGCKLVGQTTLNESVVVSSISGDWAQLSSPIVGYVRLADLRKV